MTDDRQKKPQPRKIRGTAIFHDDDALEFIPQREGSPVQKGVRKRGESRFYETEGEKQSSYVAHLKVAKDSEDPAAEMMEQLQYLTSGIAKRETQPPKSKALLDRPGLRVWHKKKDSKVIIQMEIDTAARGELSSQLFNLTAEINKCFAINQDSLRPATR